MATTRFTPAADHHINAIRTDVRTVARTIAVVLAAARTRMATIAANYALPTHRSGANHV